MADLLVVASWVVAGAAALVAAAVVAGSRDLVAAVACLLDLLLAAGLLRLSADPAWSAIGATAAIVVLRKVVVFGIDHAAPTVRTLRYGSERLGR